MRTSCRVLVAVAVLGACQSRAPTGGAETRETTDVPDPPAVTVTPMAMVMEPAPPAPAEVAAPWSLTASDGSGLELVRVDARAVGEGPLAFTELHLYFHNPEDRAREGTFAITLPSGAAVSRFAMENDGHWQEAEVVARATARRAYDDFLHQRQDPALLEKAAGNLFSAKVFPIPAKADKHLVVSFSQELVGRAYTLPLRGLPRTKHVDVSLAGTKLDGTPANQSLSERDWQPDRDFVATAAESAAAVRSGTLVIAALELGSGAPTTAEPPNAVTLLVDTSASRALGYAAYVQSVHGLVDAMRAEYGDPIELQVIAFDQDTQAIFDGAAAGYGAAEDAALIARGAAGASDLAQAIAALRDAANLHRRVIVVTDGVMTAGPETPALIAAIEGLPIERLDVVLAGGIRDERLAGSIVHTHLARAGDVHDLDRGATQVAAGLGEPVRVDVAVEVPGAEWVYPTTIPAVRAGSSVMVYARMKDSAETIDVVLGGDRRTIRPYAGTDALVERAAAGAEIAELEDRLETTEDATAKKALRAEIAKRSVSARVLSSQTSMIVLETEADYARYRIERNALADILVVGANGIEATHRTAIAVAKKKAARDDDIASGFDDVDVYGGLLADEAEEMQGGFGHGRSGERPGGGGTGWGTIETGHYGVIGRGSGTGAGYGVSGGRGGMRGRSASVPAVRIGQPTAQGDLDRTMLRRYIRRHLAQITYCYEKELLSNPALEGTVTTSFLITESGAVTEATASGVDETVAACVAGVLAGIEFPAVPGGGPVQVNYPFTFRPPDGSPTPEPAPEPAPEPIEEEDPEEDRGGPPLTGKLARVMNALARKNVAKAYELAKTWHDGAPGDVLALIALGEALEAKKDRTAAARIYGSIIDLFPGRADMRRFAASASSASASVRARW